MSVTRFLLGLIGVSGLCILLLFCMRSNPVLAQHIELGWLSLIIFVFLTVSIYGLALFTSSSKNPNHFTSFFLGVTFFKLFICAGLLYAYQTSREPGSKYFVIPFLVVYLIFTVFEVYVMAKVGSRRNAPPSQPQ